MGVDMKTKILLLAIIAFITTTNSAIAQQNRENPFYGDRERGWYFGELPPVEEDVKEKESHKSNSSPEMLSPSQMLKKQGEDFENAMATAILNPTLENYQEYLAQMNQIQSQSDVFAEGFKQAIWLTPEYDYTLQKPRNSEAIRAQSQEANQDNFKTMHEMADENGLIFFFRSDCPYCHKYAPILKRFADDHGFTVIPVSLDGGNLPEFPYPKQNYDLGRKLKVEAVPALYMVNPDSNTVVPVGFGFNDYSAITQKVLFAGQQMDGTTEINRRSQR